MITSMDGLFPSTSVFEIKMWNKVSRRENTSYFNAKQWSSPSHDLHRKANYKGKAKSNTPQKLQSFVCILSNYLPIPFRTLALFYAKLSVLQHPVTVSVILKGYANVFFIFMSHFRLEAMTPKHWQSFLSQMSNTRVWPLTSHLQIITAWWVGLRYFTKH